MAKIYKLYLVHRATEAWYALSETEQHQLFEKVDQALAQAGGQRLVQCDSAWSSEQCPAFGVEVLPDLEAAQKHTKLLNDLNWYRYLESPSVLGTESTMG